MYYLRPRASILTPRLGLSRGDGSRGTLCRYGTFWPSAYSAGLVALCLSGFAPQLFWARGAASRQSGGDRESVLPSCPRMGGLPAGRARVDSHDNRLAGCDFGSLFADPPGGAARLSAAHAGPPYLRGDDWTG